ncbi:MAG: hypothetical protein A3J48_00570 [Candidatus Doudnabacteria bacterium RIFCSPHIGHO2_02_FULL_46_11]|uniref:Uncharacterized protein n=1 Tax=Candidatus Doudnabacteria bacterium RIFCSPHIGHO2_02_FULL_46_11 TaxID=1817832 RepID=A0A1F5P539_9BACT|nr:MAG: hypothetical protein A3J48_00570 [Candidatus Doudnabacteria bacterium RIFCSPHIGHO2_02_FULL_46_11]
MRKLSIAALAVIIVAVAIAAAIMAREPSLNEQFSDDALVRLDFVDLQHGRELRRAVRGYRPFPAPLP